MYSFGKYFGLKAFLWKVVPNKENSVGAGTCVWKVWNGEKYVRKIKGRWEGKYYPLTEEVREYLKGFE